jgi:hypothetical protein
VAGVHEIFLIGALLMTIAVVFNYFLREVALRKKGEHVGAEPVVGKPRHQDRAGNDSEKG